MLSGRVHRGFLDMLRFSASRAFAVVTKYARNRPPETLRFMWEMLGDIVAPEPNERDVRAMKSQSQDSALRQYYMDLDSLLDTVTTIRKGFWRRASIYGAGVDRVGASLLAEAFDDVGALLASVAPRQSLNAGAPLKSSSAPGAMIPLRVLMDLIWEVGSTLAHLIDTARSRDLPELSNLERAQQIVSGLCVEIYDGLGYGSNAVRS